MTVNPASPQVSIVMPSFNQGRFLRAAIESVFHQSCSNLELIVIDRGSSDETHSILRSYEKRLRWLSLRDINRTNSVNTGLQMASGSIISCLDADNCYLPHAIQHGINAFERRPDANIVYGDFYVIDEEGCLYDKIKTIPFDHDVLLYDANFICRSTSFFRRRLFEEIGCFDDSLHHLEDYEFFLRAAKRRMKFHMVNEYIAAIRHHDRHEILQYDSFPWLDEYRKIRMMYARPKVRRPSAMRLLRLIFRIKRYYRLMRRGRIDFINLHLAYRMKKLITQYMKKSFFCAHPLIKPR